MGRRPCAWCVVWLVAGTAVRADAGTDGLWIGALAAALAALLLTVWAPVLRWPVAAAACLCLGSVLARGAELRARVPDPLGLLVATPGSRTVEVRGTVEPDIRWEADGRRVRAGLHVDATKVADTWQPITGRVWWSWYDPTTQIQPGRRVQVRGRLREARGFRNRGLFDYGAYLRRRGYHAQMWARGADAVTFAGEGTLPFRHALVARMQRYVSAGVSRIPASDEGRGFLLAILSGDRRWVGAETRDAGRLTGTYHLLSISGLHVGIVAAVALVCLRAVGLRRGAGTLVVLLVLAAYATLTGGAVPVVRAALMFGLALGLLRLRRAPDGPSIVALVAGAIVLLDPVAFRSAGCQLSFGAVAGLVLAYRPAARRLYAWSDVHVPARWRRPVLVAAHALLVPAIVHLTIAPILLWHFHRVPWISIPANTVATPLLGVALVLGAVAVVTLSIHPWLGALPALAAGGVTDLLLAWIRLMARVADYAPGVATMPRPAVVAAYAAALAAAWFVLRHRPLWRTGTVAAGLVLLQLAPGGPAPRGLEITALDVGQADATVLRFPNGRVMLVDGGARSRTFDAGEYLVVPHLLRQGIRRVDWVVATHGDRDHVGGLITVLESLPVGEVWTNGSTHDTWTARTFRARAADDGRRPVVVRRGRTLRVGDDVTVRVLNPPAERYAGTGNDENENSIVLRVDYGDVAVLLAADASAALADAVAVGAPWPERVIVKAPHHGFPKGDTAAPLQTLRPVLSWASLGSVWPPRWPVPGLRGARTTWRTDWHGALRIRITRDGAIAVDPTVGEGRSWPARRQRTDRVATAQARAEEFGTTGRGGGTGLSTQPKRAGAPAVTAIAASHAK